MFLKKKIKYIFNINNLGRKSLLIQVQNVLNNHILFGFY